MPYRHSRGQVAYGTSYRSRAHAYAAVSYPTCCFWVSGCIVLAVLWEKLSICYLQKSQEGLTDACYINGALPHCAMHEAVLSSVIDGVDFHSPFRPSSISGVFAYVLRSSGALLSSEPLLPTNSPVVSRASFKVMGQVPIQTPFQNLSTMAVVFCTLSSLFGAISVTVTRVILSNR